MKEFIECETCKKELASTAAACPSCGARNEWIHPKIRRLLEAGRSGKVTTPRPAEFFHDRVSVWGRAPGSRMRSFLLWAGLAVVLSAFTPIGDLSSLEEQAQSMLIRLGLLLLIVSGAARLLLGPNREKEFRADLASDPLGWQSNDDRFWQPIRDLLMLPADASSGQSRPAKAPMSLSSRVIYVAGAIIVGGPLLYGIATREPPQAESAPAPAAPIATREPPQTRAAPAPAPVESAALVAEPFDYGLTFHHPDGHAFQIRTDVFGTADFEGMRIVSAEVFPAPDGGVRLGKIGIEWDGDGPGSLWVQSAGENWPLERGNELTAAFRDGEGRQGNSADLDFQQQPFSSDVRNLILFPMTHTRLELARQAADELRANMAGNAPATVIEHEVAAIYEREGLNAPGN